MADIESLAGGMFNDPECDQRPYVYGWLKKSWKCFYRQHQWLPGQALVWLVQSAPQVTVSRLVTVMFGGRSAKPYLYLTDRTDFNGDLFGAEHSWWKMRPNP